MVRSIPLYVSPIFFCIASRTAGILDPDLSQRTILFTCKYRAVTTNAVTG